MTDPLSEDEVKKPTSRKLYYGKYFIGVVITGGSLLLATQTGSLILTIITFLAYSTRCLYYIAVKEPKRRKRFKQIRSDG